MTTTAVRNNPSQESPFPPGYSRDGCPPASPDWLDAGRCIQRSSDTSCALTEPARGGIHTMDFVKSYSRPRPHGTHRSQASATRNARGHGRRSQWYEPTEVWACASSSRVRCCFRRVSRRHSRRRPAESRASSRTHRARCCPASRWKPPVRHSSKRVRSVVTDSEGRYNIIDLRPGTYLVTFTLAGFNMFRRDGIELPSGFTATVNAEMQVGALTETITVTGESPLVDTRNARKQTVVSSDLLNVLPSSVKNLNNLVTLTPGFRGNEGFDVTGAYSGQIGGTFHGKAGTNVQFDGMGIQHASGNQGYNANAETVQEMVHVHERHHGRQQRRRRDREHDPQGGRQQVRGQRSSGLYSNNNLMSDNLSDDLIARGLKSVNSLNYIYDAGFTLGGPIKKDRLWFYGSFREWGNERQAANKFYNATQAHAVLHSRLESAGVRQGMVRVEGDAGDVAGVGEKQVQLLRRSPARLPLPGADSERIRQRAGSVLQLSTSSRPGSIRSPGARRSPTSFCSKRAPARADGSWPIYRQPEVTRDDVSIVEQSTGMRYNSGTPTFGPLYYTTQLVPRFSQRFSASYVTGRSQLQGRSSVRGKLPRDRGRKRDQQRGVRLQQPGAGQPHAVGHAIRTQGAEQGLRVLRAGSVDAPAPDVHLRCSLRIFQRLRSGAARRLPRRTGGSPSATSPR